MILLSSPLSARRFGHRSAGDVEHLRADSEFAYRIIRGIKCLPEIGFLERIDVDDDDTAMLHMVGVLLQGGSVHGDEDVAFVTGSVDVVSDADLEA